MKLNTDVLFFRKFERWWWGSKDRHSRLRAQRSKCQTRFDQRNWARLAELSSTWKNKARLGEKPLQNIDNLRCLKCLKSWVGFEDSNLQRACTTTEKLQVMRFTQMLTFNLKWCQIEQQTILSLNRPLKFVHYLKLYCTAFKFAIQSYFLIFKTVQSHTYFHS